MKKYIQFMQFAIVIIAFSILSSCGSSKDMPRGAIDKPCYGDKYLSSKGFIRASGMGESKDMNLSMKIARSNTLEALASKISTSVQTVANNYYSSTAGNNSEEMLKKYESITKEVVDTKINGYEIECDVTTQAKNGMYQTYYCFRLAEEHVLVPLLKKLVEEEGLNLGMDYNTFINEMHKNLK